MIITDNGEVKIGEVVLPGLFKELEIEGDSKVDEVDVKGRSTKPKQATGYEDAKVKFKLILKDELDVSILDQLAILQNIFKVLNQEKPIVLDLFNHHCNTRGITQVIFKKFKSKEDNKNELMEVTCEFWEYIPIVIQASSSAGTTSASSTGANVSPEFQAYLDGKTVDEQALAKKADDANAARYTKAYEAHRKQRVAAAEASKYKAMDVKYGKRSRNKYASSPAVDNDKPSYFGGRG